MILHRWLLSTTCLCALGFGGPARAADIGSAPGTLPAVSEINGKAATYLGSVNGDFATGVLGSLSFPVGHDFGIQLDGAVGSASGAAFWGVGGHAFWRDPARGLIGFYGSYSEWDLATTAPSAILSGGFVDTSGADVGKVGAEAQAYLGRVSLEGQAGYQFGTREGFSGRAKLAFYPLDNLRLAAGVSYLTGPGAVGTLDVEWQPRLGSGLSLYASGSAGSADNWSAVGGVRVYFSHQDKSLIRRHREDDPEGLDLPHDLFTAGGSPYCVSPEVIHLDGLTCYSPP